MSTKEAVVDFWDRAACGEDLLLRTQDHDGFDAQANARYRLEPYVVPFADFTAWGDRDVLEVGLGLGADHERFAVNGARMSGIDLTGRAVEITRKRFELKGLRSALTVGDSELLPYDDASFDLVYSWGVIHHTPDTPKAASEILRVLRPGGEFRVMIYHTYSLVGVMLWLRYALMRGRPLTSFAALYAAHLESPGTKAYTRAEAEKLFSAAEHVQTRIELTHGDLLESGAGQRHEGAALSLARLVWPRWLLRRVGGSLGLFLLVSGRKAG